MRKWQSVHFKSKKLRSRSSIRVNAANAPIVSYPEAITAPGGRSYGEARCSAVVAFSSYASILGDIFISMGAQSSTLSGHGEPN